MDKEMWPIFTMECYSVIKESEIKFAGKWTGVDSIMLCEISET
jgi:hypothetical protein